MLKGFSSIAIIIAAALTSGCASIVSDKSYPVSVNSTPTEARFTIRNESGVTVAGGTTPQTVMLPSGAGFFDGETYVVEFTKDGYVAHQATLDTSLDGWYFGNLIFGGLLGLFVVDPATGAMWKLPTTAYADLGAAQTAAK